MFVKDGDIEKVLPDLNTCSNTDMLQRTSFKKLGFGEKR